MLRFLVAVVLLAVPVSSVADLYRYEDEEGVVHFTDAPEDREKFKVFVDPPRGHGSRQDNVLGRIMSGEIQATPQMRKQFAQNMAKSLRKEPEYKGIKVNAEGKSGTTLTVSFPKANGFFAAATASSPDLVLAFYALGFNKIIFSNGKGGTWDLPISLY